MSDSTNEKEVVDRNQIQDADVVEIKDDVPNQEQPQQIEVDAQTAFSMKLQEFDVKIATAEAHAAVLKKEKFEFVYNNNVQAITEQYKQNLIKKEIEAEALKRATSKK